MNSAIKTLQIGEGWFPEQPGGLNRFYYDCTRYLPQAGVEIRGLVTGSSKVCQDSHGQIQAFAPSESPLWQRWYGVRQAFHRLLAEQEYPLVVSHFALYTLPVLDQLRKRPLVTHFHGPWTLESSVESNKSVANKLKKAIEQIAYRRTVNFIVLSKTFRDILHQQYRVPWERIHIVPGGVDMNHFDLTMSRTEVRAKLGWSQDRFIIFTVRRLAKRMGLENLIAAVDKVRHHYPEVLLQIAGKGALASTLKAQIEQLGLTEHVRLLGYVPDEKLALAYRAVDLTVVPTVSLEGFGLIVVESLAAGTPVLGTPVGGLPEILEPFSQNLVFEGYTSEQLAQGMIEALSGQRQLPSSPACQAYIQQNYAWHVIAQQIKSVYQASLA